MGDHVRGILRVYTSYQSLTRFHGEVSKYARDTKRFFFTTRRSWIGRVIFGLYLGYIGVILGLCWRY